MQKLKLFKPYVSKKAISNVIEVLQGTQLAEGPKVKQFEEEFGKKFGFKHVAAVNSGTAALELAYEIAGITEGAEVITPVLTCTATNLPLIHRKATIVFADTDRDLNMSISDIKRKITQKTKAVVFVHFGGNNRGLKELLKLCKEKKIILIEDAAQAVGSDFWGKADFTCVSLQAIKTLTSGDGGFIICKNKDDHAKAKRLRWFGYDREAKQRLGDTDLLEAGYKYHMNDISAAIGLGNLSIVDKLINHRKKLMAVYKDAGFISNIWMTAVLANYKENKLKLEEQGFEVGQHHYRNDKYTVFGGRKNFPIMDELEENYFFVPMHHDVSVADAKKIVKIIKGTKK